jgi:hydroxyacylglutathione hydrolase
MDNFFKTKLIADRIWSIDGSANDLMYLVEGSQKAMLVDTGMGIGNLSDEIRKITDLPLIIVNTHGHPDHAGGNSNFSEVWFPLKDLSIMKTTCKDEYRVQDLKSFHGEQSPVFQHFLAGLVPYKDVVLQPITTGQVFDLGDRQFEVVEIPGHTPGCVGFLNSKEKLFFTGDSIVQTPVWMYLKHSLPFLVYLESLKKVKTREQEFETLFPGHNPTPVGKKLLDDLIECAEEIAQKKGVGERTKTFRGEGLLWKYGQASIIYDPVNWE